MILQCDECEAVVDAAVLNSYMTQPNSLAPVFRISFAKCPRCSAPFLATEEEDFDGWQQPERLYPVVAVGLHHALPKPIRVAFEEARTCFRAKAYTASAIMCRKTLEGICAEHGVSERTLSRSLAAMKEQGVIESRLYEWAEALRISGNEAAHDVGVALSAQDASDIVDFTHALIEYVFTFRDRFKAFKERRAAGASGA